jgi:Zn finger protein HypA/HybF involved in hydrogenase expression
LNAAGEMAFNEILFSILNREINKFVCTYERFSNHYFFDPPMDRKLRVTQADLLNALEMLENYNYTTSEETLTLYCIECFSVGLHILGKCPQCGSEKVRKSHYISHSCGYRGNKDKFTDNGNMICPNCNKKLYQQGLDYTDEETKYSCVSCGSIFDNYMTFYKCSKCGASYKQGEEPAVSVRIFTPTAKVENERNQLTELFSSVDFLTDLLKKQGFSVSKKTIIETKLGETFLDAVAYSQTNRRRIGISLQPVNSERVLIGELKAKKERANLDMLIAVVYNKPKEEIAEEMRMNGIYLTECAACYDAASLIERAVLSKPSSN